MTPFDFNHYKDCLGASLDQHPEKRGVKTKLAQHLGVQMAFVSQVLHADAHLSLEHAIKVSQFFNWSEKEGHFFFLLLQFARAGSKELENYFSRQIDEIRSERAKIRSRVQANNSLSNEELLKFFSSWQYAALHILLSIPKFQDLRKTARRLGVSVDQVQSMVVFLEEAGLIVRENDQVRLTNRRIHLEPESPMIAQHHTQWRLSAMQALQRKDSINLHYSLGFSAAEIDAEKIRKVLLEAIEKSDQIFKPSPEEDAFGLNIDFYRI